MFFRETRSHLRIGLIAALAVASCPVLHAATCVVETSRPASSFLCSEPIRFSIVSDLPAQQLTWSVLDHEDELRAEGEIMAAAGTTTLTVRPSPGVGYYTLHLRYESGETFEKVFCILPHPDEARGDGGLWGLGLMSVDPKIWDAAWQIGARHFRTEFAWTSVEHEPGQYNMDWVRTVAALARERDMQMTVLTGHTPRFYGVRPYDATDSCPPYYLWQPQDTIEWYRFIDTMSRALVPQRLDPAPTEPTDTLARSSRPLVRAWEVWSEADQNFYFGSWARYLDMLRIAWCTVRRQGRVPIVYGSCGHMTEMKWTLEAGCADYFDRIAHHPYRDTPDWMLMHWYRNMPQALLATGNMCETALTECGFHSPEEDGEAGFMSRVYALLKIYDEDLFVRSGCLGGVFTRNDAKQSLARIVDGRLEPRPAYVAFAVTRWLLESAEYVGPLEAPEGARVELFLRQGTPVVIAWMTEGTARVSIDISPRAVLMDALGKTRPLSGPVVTIDLSTDAVAVLGASWVAFSEAADAGLDLVLETELGHISPTDSRWIDPLENDIDTCAGAGTADNIRDACEGAIGTIVQHPPWGPAALFKAQRVLGDAMLDIIANAREEDDLNALDRDTLWRLVRYSERLGRIADNLGQRWPRMNNVDEADMQKTRGAITRVRTRVAEATGGAECPFADRLLDRALDSLDAVRQSGGHDRGAWWAATVTARAAHALSGIERPQMRKVFMTGNFATGNIIWKGILLEPGSQHTVQARIYNFLDEDVTGHIRPIPAEEWGDSGIGASFTVPAGGPSEPVDIAFSIPGQPTPWIQEKLPNLWEKQVDLPPSVDLQAEVGLVGEIACYPLEPMTYRVCVGRYPSRSEVVESPKFTTGPVRDDELVWAFARSPASGTR